jgi:hypothetical protein
MKLSQHEAIVSKSDVFNVDWRQLKIEPGLNVRDWSAPQHQDELERLMEAIDKDGVRTPVLIRMVGDDLYLVHGHGRLEAVTRLAAKGRDIRSVPATAEPKSVNAVERKFQVVSLNAQTPLTDLEMAQAVKDLLNMGVPREEIRERFGYKTIQSIANAELLLGAPREVIKDVEAGVVAPTAVVELMREHGDNAGKVYDDLKQKAVARSKKGGGRRKQGSVRVADVLATKDSPKRPIASLEKAIKALAELADSGISAEKMATDLTTLAIDPDDLAKASDWLYAFADARRFEQEQRQSQQRSAIAAMVH